MIGLHLVLLLVAVGSALAVTHRNVNFTAATISAQAFVSQLSNSEKVNIVSGIGTGTRLCQYNTAAVRTFPGLCFADGPLGIRTAYGVSEFPAGINAAQTWDRDLIYQRGYAIGEEVRGKGINVLMGPDVNMARTPLAGRNWEGFGADPYLCGEASFATVQGHQDAGIIANPKHFVGNEQEHFRSSSNSIIDDRTLREVYGWPFKKAADASAASIMCSFNNVNGPYACHSPYMNSILRDEYGFKGFVVSDYNAAHDTQQAINNGLDMTQPNALPFGSSLLSAIGNGVTQQTLDTAAVRVVAAWYALGQDKGYPPVSVNVRDPAHAPVVNVNTSAHAALIRQMGAESAVLLRNKNKLLPLQTGIKIGVFGTDSMMPTILKDSTAGTWLDGTVSMGYGSGSVWWPYLIPPITAIKAKFGSTKVTSAPNDFDLTTAKTVASQVDVAIVFANVNSGENYVSIDNNFGDRNNYSLWHNGDNLINAVASKNTKTIVVLHITGQVNINAWVNNPNVAAIILAGTPGQETGNSLVDVLTGAVNPSGKLAYTIAKNDVDYPAQLVTTGTGTVPVNYAEKLLVDYRWFDKNNIQPWFEFGFGLSYTTFVYSAFSILGANQIPYGTGNGTTVISAQVTITNNGTVAGKEVVQLYVGFPAAAGEPPRVLRGFEKVSLAAGASTIVTFNLTGILISIWDISSKSWQIVPGTYTLYAAASSRDLRQITTFDVTGSVAGQDLNGPNLSGQPIVTPSAVACEAQCRNTAGCTAWSFAFSGANGCSVTNQCYLKSSAGTPVANACRQYGVI